MFRSIRTIAIAVVLGVAALHGIGSGLYFAMQSRQSSQLIEQWKSERSDLAANVVSLAGKSLQSMAYDYTYWDEMLEFVASGDSEWAHSNIDESLPTYEADAVWVYSTDFRLIYSANDMDGVLEIGGSNLDESLLRELPLTCEQMDTAVTRDRFPHLFVRTPRGLLELRGAPVQPSNDAERVTAPQAWFFVGRIWSPSQIERIGHLTGCRMALHPAGMRREFHARDASRPWIFTYSEPLPGWDGVPLAYLCGVGENADMEQTIRQARVGFWLHLAYAAVVVTALSIILVRYITNPLRRISESLRREDPKMIEPLKRHPTELGQLAGLIGEFFAQRERLQREVREHEQSLRALAESEERFRELADLLPVIVFETNEQGDVTFFNRCTQESFGYTEADLAGRINVLERVVPEDRARAAANIQKQREQLLGGGRTEYTAVRKDGTRFDVLLESTPIIREGKFDGLRVAAVDITTLKQTEVALRNSEELLRQMAEAIPSMFWMTSADQKEVLYVSPAYETIYGRSLKGRTPTVKEWREAICIEDQPRVLKHVLEHAQEGWEIEYRILRLDGTMRWLRERAVAVRDERGRTCRMAGLTEDITERKEVENAVRESQERFRSLSDAAPVLIWMAGVDRHSYYFNKTWLSFTGRALPQEYGKGWQQSVHPDDLERVIEIYRNAFVSRCAFTIEYRIRHADGTYHWVFDRGAPRFGADGSFAGYIGTAVDITDRRQAEDALRSSEERFRAIFETAHDAIFIKNTRLIYTHVNPAMEKLHGRPAAHIVGRRLDELVDPETARRMEETDRRALAGQTAETEFTAEVKGIPTTIEVVKVPMRDRGGQIVGLCGIARDVTDRRRAAEEIARWNQRYELIVAASGQIVYDYDVVTGQILWSGSTESVLGYPPGMMTHDINEWADRVHPEDREETLRLLDVAEKEIGSYDCEYRFRRADDEYVWMHDRGFFTSDGSGRAVRMLGTMRDVSDRRLAQQEMWNSLSLLKATLESTADGILVVDRDGKVSTFNHRFLEMWRIPQSVAEQQDDDEFLHLVLNQLEHPEEFLACVRELYGRPEAEGFDTLAFLDGRVFERYSSPQYLNEEVVGRVWCFRDVTDRTQAANALLAERRIFTAGPVVAYRDRIGPDWPAEYVSPNSKIVLGYEPEEFTSGRIQVRDLLHPDDRQRILDETAQHLAAGTQVYEQEYRILHPDGEYRWMHDLTTVQRNADGVPEHVQGYVLDITDRKRVEQALRESEARLHAMLDAVPDIMFRLDRDGVFLDYSAKSNKDLYAAPSEFLGKRVDEVLPPPIGETLHRMVAEVARTGVTRFAEYVLPVEGRDRTFEARLARCGSEGVLVIVRDTTVRKNAETALAEKAAHYRAIVEAAPFPMVVTRVRDGYIHYCNDPFLAALALTREQIQGRSLAEFYVYPTERSCVVERLQRDGRISDHTMAVRRGDGTIVQWVGSAQMMELDGEEAVVAVVMGVMPGAEPEQSEGRAGVAVSVRHQVEELYSEIRDALLRTREAIQSEQPTPKQNDLQP